MKALPFLRGAGVFLFLVLLHYTVRPLVGTRVNADFLLIAVMLTALDVRPGAAAAIGFATGLISDSLAPSSFGAGALSLSIVGFTASWLRAAVFGDNLLLQAFFIAAGKWCFDLVYLVAERRLPLGSMVAQLLVWSPLSAVVTGLAGLMVAAVFRRGSVRQR